MQFDGVDDFVEVRNYFPRVSFQNEGFTIEVIFRVQQFGADQLLYSQSNDNGGTSIGFNAQGQVVVGVDGVEHAANHAQLHEYECHHLSIVFNASDIDVYLEGNLVETIVTGNQMQTQIDMDNSLFLGSSPNGQSHFFHGVMEEFRVFDNQLSHSEISSYIFAALPLSNGPRFIYLNFMLFDNTMATTRDPFEKFAIGFLGGFDLIATSQPEIVEFTCGEDWNFDLPESVDPNCQPLPPCVPGPIPGNLLCNGDFEQFCPSLYNVLPAYRGAWCVFPFPLVPPCYPGSDVSNWDTHFIHSYPLDNGPAFLVRGGTGVNWGWPTFTPNIPSLVDTHNGLGDGVLELMSVSVPVSYNPAGALGMAAKTPLLANLLPNTDYEISLWTYTSQAGTVFKAPGVIEINLVDNMGNNPMIITNMATINYQDVIGNNHWEFHSFRFTTPDASILPTYAHHLSIQNVTHSFGGPSSGGNIIYIDDVIFEELPKTNFPKTLDFGIENDFYNRRILTNDTGVFVLGTYHSTNSSTIDFGAGSLSVAPGERFSVIIGYDASGNLHWVRDYRNVIFHNFKFMNNGNIIAVGETVPYDLDIVLTSNPFNGIFHNEYPTIASSGFTCNNDFYVYNVNNSIDLAFAEIDIANGHPIGFIQAYGGLGTERVIDVAVVGSTAYLLAEVHDGTIGHPDCPSLNRTYSGAINWGGTNPNVTHRDILTLDLNNFANRNRAAYTGFNSAFYEIQSYGNELVILTAEDLFGFSTGTTPGYITNVPLTAGPDEAKVSHITNNGDLYLLYPRTSAASTIEKRELSAANFGVLETATTSYVNVGGFTSYTTPVDISSMNGAVYLMSYFHQSWTSPYGMLEVSRLDLSPNANFGDLAWFFRTSGSNSNFGTPIIDQLMKSNSMAANSSIDALALVGRFSTGIGPWDFTLPPKVLSGTTANPGGFSQHVNYAFVGLVREDNNGGYFFKSDEPETPVATFPVGSTLQVYPNPAKNHLDLKSDVSLRQYAIYNLQGQLIQAAAIDNRLDYRIDNLTLAAGMYLIEVTTDAEKHHVRIVFH